MSGIETTAQPGWPVEVSPIQWSAKRLAIWIFIFSDAVTFSAILLAYGYLRISSSNWTEPFAFAPTVLNAAVMTIVLLTSSVTMVGAMLSARAGRKSATVRWLVATILLGIVFTALHLREWFLMIHDGWRLFYNPLGGSVLFGATYFSITGFHILHVIAGCAVIAAVAIGYKRGRLDSSHVETTALYWHFVDLVWMFVFPFVYLMNVR